MKRRDPRRPVSRRARRTASAPALTRSPERHLLWLLVGLVAVTALAYQPAWHGGILWDDDAHLTRRGFTDAGGLWRIWSDVGSTPQYYPVTHTAFWLMNYAWGINPLGYHLVSIGLHAMSAVLLAAILRRLAVPGAILAAVVFALHPVHAESVAWISAPLAALLFFVVTLFPALGFIDVFPFKYSFVADHFQYLASLGIIVLLCGAIAQAVTRRGRPAMLTAGTGMIGAVLGALTWQQSHQYVDAATLYRTTLERNPSSWMAHNNLGALLVHGSDAEAARAAHHLQEAIRLNPEEPEAHTNLGLVWDRLGRREEALQAHREALRLDPGFAEAHYNLGNTLVELTRHEEAAAAYKESLRINPYSAETRHNLSTTLAATGRLAEAMSYAREALEIRPDSAEIRQNMGNLLLRTGRASEAIDEYRAALRLKPGSGETYNNLGLALRKAGRLPEALDAFEASLRSAPDSALVHVNMAEVLRALGRTEEATAHMRAAALLDPRYRP